MTCIYISSKLCDWIVEASIDRDYMMQYLTLITYYKSMNIYLIGIVDHSTREDGLNLLKQLYILMLALDWN